MNKIIQLILVLCVSGLYAQTITTERTDGSIVTEISKVINPPSYGATALFVNPVRKATGSVHLFDKWNNYAVIFTSDGGKFSLKNINLNIERNTFQSKIDGDSIFSFNFNNIEKFVVNNRAFKNYYYNDDNRVYEIIYENDKFSLMKGFKVSVMEGSANPMLNRSADRYIRKEFYFVKQGDRIKPFKLKKSRILKLVDGDTEKAANIEAYVEANDLSYKKEYDVHRILTYGAKIR